MRRKPALLLVAALVGATSLLAPPAFAETADDPVDDAVVVTTAEAPAPVEGAPEPAPDPESDPADPEPSRDVADDTDAPPAPAPTPQPAPAEEEAPDPTGEVPPPDPVEQSDPVVEEDPVVGEPTEEDPVAEDTASTIAGVTSSGCLVTVSVNTADDWAKDIRVTGTTVDGEAYQYVTELSHAATGITVDKSFLVDEAIDGSLTVELLAEGAVVDDWTGDLGLEECAPAPDNTVIHNVTVDGCEVTVTLLVGNDKSRSGSGVRAGRRFRVRTGSVDPCRSNAGQHDQLPVHLERPDRRGRDGDPRIARRSVDRTGVLAGQLRGPRPVCRWRYGWCRYGPATGDHRTGAPTPSGTPADRELGPGEREHDSREPDDETVAHLPDPARHRGGVAPGPGAIGVGSGDGAGADGAAPRPPDGIRVARPRWLRAGRLVVRV
ncbi:MAG: hypothetical protein GXX86_12775 [Propionibacterium sp.]|nr:hypothetical protein [Propionibacterium sp.]